MRGGGSSGAGAGDNGMTQTKTYSWDNRPRKTEEELSIKGLRDGAAAGKMPASVGKEQFIIHDCIDSNIYLCDATSTVTITECRGCRIFVSPVQGR